MIFKFRKENAIDTIKCYQKVFNTPEGKIVLMDLMNKNYILNSHKGEPLAEGRRAAILDIMHFCNINISEFNKLLSDN